MELEMVVEMVLGDPFTKRTTGSVNSFSFFIYKFPFAFFFYFAWLFFGTWKRRGLLWGQF